MADRTLTIRMSEEVESLLFEKVHQLKQADRRWSANTLVLLALLRLMKVPKNLWTTKLQALTNKDAQAENVAKMVAPNV